MEKCIKNLSQLSAEELYEIYRLRVSVFVVEQSCAYQEVDEADRTALHISLKDAHGAIAAYCRLLPPDEDGEALIGRVIAVKRRQGLGSKVVALAMETAKSELNAKSLRVEAQCYAAPMYEKLGFARVSAEYLEDGIPHVTMKKSC